MTATRQNLRPAVLRDRLAACRLDASDSPPQATPDGFFSVTRTADELSMVCAEESVPEGARREKGWRSLKLEGPFEFTEVDMLDSVAPLADAGVGIFADSTFETDYVLVKVEQSENAAAALRGRGHRIT